ncbi:hypothetical protein ASZ90_009495 [hydrocarbon metagenome]|uniref:UspA domain-containing protein n=1 Tax=hydrocarbon metagenome TaxID=938273 RepID=A0A0W8FJ44_9ZZZZ|nr:universal stress protein [Methanomicrobiaceae archaeon]
MTQITNPGRVLVPLDVKESGAKIVSAAEEIARLGAEEIRLLHVAHVRDTLADPKILEYDAEVLGAWKERLIACGAAAVTTEVVSGIPAIEIEERAERDGYSLIVLGSHGRRLLSRVILGSTTEDVLRHATIPILIVRLKIIEAGEETACRLAADRLFSRILYATDFSAYADRCIPCLAWMSRAEPEELAVVHIQDTRHLAGATPEEMAEFDRRDTGRLEALRRQFLEAGFSNVSTVLRTGNAAEEIPALAEELGATLIVLGAKGRHGIAERILGGVTEAVVYRSAGHVLVVR